MSHEQQSMRKRGAQASPRSAARMLLTTVATLVVLCLACSKASPMRDETRSFFGRVRGGQAREAYDGLAATRRAQLSFERFQAELDRPVFRGHDRVVIAATQSHDDRWGCTRGDLEMGGRDWTFEMYLVREGDAWRVHTWVVDEPAIMDRLNKLEQCRQW